jgi:hypothetical protein
MLVPSALIIAHRLPCILHGRGDNTAAGPDENKARFAIVRSHQGKMLTRVRHTDARRTHPRTNTA